MNPLFRWFVAAHRWAYERTGGRLGGRLAGRPMLLLDSVGRRSGQHRTVPLMYVTDGDAFVLVASNNGSDRHPGWYHNLVAAPETTVQVGGEHIAVRARVAEGEERARLWAEADRVNRGGYGRYTGRTDREIPVVVLERR